MWLKIVWHCDSLQTGKDFNHDSIFAGAKNVEFRNGPDHNFSSCHNNNIFIAIMSMNLYSTKPSASGNVREQRDNGGLRPSSDNNGRAKGQHHLSSSAIIVSNAPNVKRSNGKENTANLLNDSGQKVTSSRSGINIPTTSASNKEVSDERAVCCIFSNPRYPLTWLRRLPFYSHPWSLRSQSRWLKSHQRK